MRWAATLPLVALLVIGTSGAAGAETPDVGRAPDIRRPDEPFGVTLFGRRLTIGGEFATEVGWEGDFALRRSDDDLGYLVQELALELTYPLSDDVSLFVQGLAFWEGLYEGEGGDGRVEGGVELGEAWLLVEDIAGSDAAVQLGRQAVWEERNWWWDDTVDALRLLWDGARLEGQIAAGRDVGRLTIEQGGPTRARQDGFQTFGHLGWRWADAEWLDGFVVFRDGTLRESTLDRPARRDDDAEERDACLVWLGTRLSGEHELGGWRGELDHLVEGAWVGGSLEPDHEAGGERRDVSAFALVTEAAWETALPAEPALTVGWAFGSGDRGGGTDGTFRQTGLGSNDLRFDGVEYFDGYGELLEPELSNLHVFTLAVGVRVLERSSLVLVHHAYLQAEPAPVLRDADLLVEPEGRQREIGHAWDLVLGLQEWKRVEVDLIGSLFRAGPAYGDREGNLAWGLGVSVEINF